MSLSTAIKESFRKPSYLLVLLVLLVFILQNLDPVQIYFLGFAGSLPVGVAMLLSAIAGLLLIAIPGGVRIWQLRRAATKAQRKR